jgi:hypothetical protein
VISLLDNASSRHGHWLLPCGGYPQAFAALLASPLLASGAPARRWREWLLVLAPLPLLSSPHQPPEGSPQVHYRYLLRLAEGPAAARICCWRRYGDGIGWQRRCGPMALELFISHFASSASLPSVPNRPYAAQFQAAPAEVAPTYIAPVASTEAVQLLFHTPQVQAQAAHPPLPLSLGAQCHPLQLHTPRPLSSQVPIPLHLTPQLPISQFLTS